MDATSPRSPLTSLERDMLDYEQTWWRDCLTATRGDIVARRFQLTLPDYQVALTRLISRPEALAYAPVLVRRLRRARRTSGRG